MAPWGSQLAVMVQDKTWAPAWRKPGKSAVHPAISFLTSAGQLRNSARLRVALRQTKAALLQHPAALLLAICSLSARAKMDNYEWLRYLATPLGVMFYAYLFYLSAERSRRRAARGGPTNGEKLYHHAYLLGRKIRFAYRRFRGKPLVDDPMVIDGIARRID